MGGGAQTGHCARVSSVKDLLSTSSPLTSWGLFTLWITLTLRCMNELTSAVVWLRKLSPPVLSVVFGVTRPQRCRKHTFDSRQSIPVPAKSIHGLVKSIHGLLQVCCRGVNYTSLQRHRDMRRGGGNVIGPTCASVQRRKHVCSGWEFPFRAARPPSTGSLVTRALIIMPALPARAKFKSSHKVQKK